LNLPYDAKSDIFALGALVLELYQGEEIFRSSSNIDQLYWILEICGYPGGWAQAILRMAQLGVFFNSKKVPQIYKMTEKLRPEAESLIIGMLQTCPHSRLSIV
jgi:serine/threonine protein kinase